MSSTSKRVFSIPWQDSGSYRKGKYLLDTGLMADCSFMVGEGANAKRFDCHKIILIAASPVFETMFCGGFKEANTTNPIPIPDSQPEVFRLFLEFIYDPCQSSARIYYDESCSDYSDEDDYRYAYSDGNESRDDILSEKFQSYNFDTLKNLLYLGNKYMIKSLGRQCCLALNQQLRIGNEECILRIFELAITTEHRGLAKKSAQHFEQEFSLVATEVIYDLDASILCEFIKYLELTPSREVLETINIYIERNSLNVDAHDINEFEYGICQSCENPYKRKRNELKTDSSKHQDFHCDKWLEKSRSSNGGDGNAMGKTNSICKRSTRAHKSNAGDVVSTSKNCSSSSSSSSSSINTSQSSANSSINVSSTGTGSSNNAKPSDPADRERNLQMVKQLYESVNFIDMDPLEFLKAAKKPGLSEYLSYRRKYEILEKLCKNTQRNFSHQRKRKWHLINYVKQ